MVMQRIRRKTAPQRVERLAHALGWFSLALGVAEIVAPRRVARLAGVSDQRALLRIFGLREIVSAVGILAQPRPAGWLWGRAIGDVMDLALVGAKPDPARRGRRPLAMAALAGVMFLDIMSGVQLADGSARNPRAMTRFRAALS